MLTNSYALVATGGSMNFYSTFEAELQDVIPICHTTIASTRIVGRLTAGYVFFSLYTFLPPSPLLRRQTCDSSSILASPEAV